MNCVVYMDLRPFQCAHFRWIKAFKAGKFSVEDHHPGRPKTSVTKANIAAVKIVVEQDARLSVRDIASCTGISEGSVQTTILKKRLDLRMVCARWVPHLLTEEQKTQRLKCARELLKPYKGCNSRVISNLLTCDETTIFEPQRRADNKQWKRKDQKRPCIAKRTISSKKMLYAIFLIQVGQSFKCLVHLVIQSLANLQEFCTEESESCTIRNDQAKDGQEFTFYMTTPPLISVMLRLVWLLKR